MELDKTVGFKVSVFRNPDAVWKRLLTNKVIKNAWIPQTLGEQVWMFFEFSTVEERNEYVENLKPFEIEVEHAQLNAKNRIKVETVMATIQPDALLMEDLNQETLNYWVK